MNKENEVAQVASEIKQKISHLTEFNGENLRNEMLSLKKALNENPSACSLLLDEDIGLAVAALRRMVGIAVTAANAPKEKKEKKSTTKLTKEELAAQLNLIPDDEL